MVWIRAERRANPGSPSECTHNSLDIRHKDKWLYDIQRCVAALDAY